MWELIRANQRKSLVLFILMGLLLLLIGYFMGEYYFGSGGGITGLFIASIIWVVLSLISYFGGDSLILSSSKAKRVTKEVHPQLFNIVEEMKIASNLKSMPKVYIINEEAPNAFATGRDPEHASVAVTSGLLARLNRDELQGVIAHELSHINNRDILFMTFAGIMLGSIVLLSDIFIYNLWFSGGSSRRYKSKSSDSGGQAQIIIIVVALALAILGPIIARLLYFAISRKREYLADACAARYTRYPEGLASALEKISSNNIKLKTASKATAGMYIVNPLLKKGRKLSDLSSTHPSTSERIKILRSMAGNAGFLDYQNAFNSVTKNKSRIIPNSAFVDKENISIRARSNDEKSTSQKKSKRDLGDLMMKFNQYAFFVCVCGLKMKIPPDFKADHVQCPKCGKDNKIPIAEFSVAADVISKSKI